MIYIFKGCQAVCEVPGKACRACGSACGECADCCCELPARACGECCFRLGLIHKRPLGGLVYFSWIVNGLIILLQIPTLSASEFFGCDTDAMMLVMGQLFFSIINCGFILYMQTRLVENLRIAAAENGMPIPPEVEPDAAAGDVLEMLKEIAMYDIGFCLYFFVFIASFCFYLFIPISNWEEGCQPLEDRNVWGYSLGIFFNIILAGFTCCHPAALCLEDAGFCFICQCCGCAPSSSKKRFQGRGLANVEESEEELETEEEHP
eukprot:gnl/TRDRNA2_/TRDRNA2_65737_c0_seq1.p1 gnl/TRDRNA2_/TRDRNA2_65737_c0~~gnl/TRDRNA2_/TRDRNA2_65737_c0_seq1.p1  ORF type:complete len:263 (+),score=43.80 gnl/TRDRNA2_/TRDRNA2_65737_c0_seq1:87-875(+)